MLPAHPEVHFGEYQTQRDDLKLFVFYKIECIAYFILVLYFIDWQLPEKPSTKLFKAERSGFVTWCAANILNRIILIIMACIAYCQPLLVIDERFQIRCIYVNCIFGILTGLAWL